jgi:hypothetical protein
MSPRSVHVLTACWSGYPQQHCSRMTLRCTKRVKDSPSVVSNDYLIIAYGDVTHFELPSGHMKSQRQRTMQCEVIRASSSEEAAGSLLQTRAIKKPWVSWMDLEQCCPHRSNLIVSTNDLAGDSSRMARESRRYTSVLEVCAWHLNWYCRPFDARG